MKTSIFKYNKDNDLVNYIEFDNNLQLKCCYNIENNILKKIYNNVFKEKNKTFTEHKRVIISFNEVCSLSHMFIDGESWVRVVKKGSNGFDFPKEKNRIETSNNCPEIYKVKKGTVENWLSILKKND